MERFDRIRSGSRATIRALLGPQISRDPLATRPTDNDRGTPLNVPVIWPLMSSGSPLARHPLRPFLFRLHTPTVATRGGVGVFSVNVNGGFRVSTV